MNIALILAGGFGARMGQDIPKQFIHVNNRPIIIYTLEKFQQHQDVDKICVVCVDGWQAILRGYALQFGISKLDKIVSGGTTRFESTYNGMMSLKNVSDEDIIIVHDAVRPMVTERSISETIRVCRKFGNSMSVLDCADTMYVRSDHEGTSSNINRDNLVRGQTPEAVCAKRMKDMYVMAQKKNLQIDSISELQVALGLKVYFAPGAENNIKLTRIEDIELFKALLQTEKDEWLK
ncbi:IspD/TarI family cytidylyltransferase [Pectinatus frisingensis]|uniref:IspD/TarI family cytidylyltransferase n=1 Tax=Pectinatus frisingensis TaxID=865 RepID=UPI0018C7337E|nr:IspD/TarI family cytidylyltransferase [Pectinatus frisingensis]